MRRRGHPDHPPLGTDLALLVAARHVESALAVESRPPAIG